MGTFREAAGGGERIAPCPSLSSTTTASPSSVPPLYVQSWPVRPSADLLGGPATVPTRVLSCPELMGTKQSKPPGAFFSFFPSRPPVCFQGSRVGKKK